VDCLWLNKISEPHYNDIDIYIINYYTGD
jgi:hypothetical protein